VSATSDRGGYLVTTLVTRCCFSSVRGVARGIDHPAYSLQRLGTEAHEPLKSLITALALTSAACNSRPEKVEAGPEVAEQPQHSPPAAPSAAAASAQAASAPAPASALTEVRDPSQVCMVNNPYMGRLQIPTTVEGKTYYGCCPMCKGRLEKEAAARTAKDPVSGRDVDKATASSERKRTATCCISNPDSRSPPTGPTESRKRWRRKSASAARS
jgi:YHS domain-containing protein